MLPCVFLFFFPLLLPFQRLNFGDVVVGDRLPAKVAGEERLRVNQELNAHKEGEEEHDQHFADRVDSVDPFVLDDKQ